MVKGSSRNTTTLFRVYRRLWGVLRTLKRAPISSHAYFMMVSVTSKSHEDTQTPENIILSIQATSQEIQVYVRQVRTYEGFFGQD